MPEFAMTIDGKAVKGSRSVGVINPATGKEFARVPDCTTEELNQAMAAAQKAFPAWSRDLEARRKVLNECAAALQSPPEGLARMLTQEQGKPLDKAGQEIMGSWLWMQYTASLQIPVEVLQDNSQGHIEIRRKPLGVVAAITPWNYPLVLAMWKIAPALLAGNTVVIKPSPFTPITTLELGGNDAAIVLADASVDDVATKIFWGAFENCGQICSAIKRVYVPQSMYAPMLEKLGELAKGAKVGNGLEAGTQIGPINNKPQFERVTELVEDAKQHGAKIVTGGKRI